MENVENDEFMVEFDGPGVDARSLDSRRALALVSAYVDLVEAIASKEDKDFKLSGLGIRNKCVAVAMTANRPDLVLQSAKTANTYVTGKVRAPAGHRDQVNKVQTAVRMLPPGHQAKVIAGPWGGQLSPVADRSASTPSHKETITLRATILGVVSKQKSTKVTLRSKSETGPFDINAHVDTARDLGSLMLETIEIVATIFRNEDGTIKSGFLQEYRALGAGEARAEWKTWYDKSASDWDAVTDVEKELGRNGD